jgi:F420H(2)-dependent quinone reductase
VAFRRASSHVDPLGTQSRPRRMILRLMSARPMVALERGLVFRLTVWRIAPRLMHVTGGRLARTLPFPADVIETRDPRNGRPHRRVVVYFHDGERVTVIPSKAGMPEDPHWYQNALADPNVIFGGQPFRAEVVDDPAAQARIWSLADRFYPPCVTYRALAARHGRSIPILQLIPR